jgi:hypothetical protein
MFFKVLNRSVHVTSVAGLRHLVDGTLLDVLSTRRC